MFPALVSVRIYEEALRLLADPSIDGQEVWLHDYKDEDYRYNPAYTLNGLHWGYPDGIVASITGKTVPGGSSMYAFFDRGLSYEDRSSCKKNYRFCLVRYGEVKSVIEKGIRQKLEKARDAVPMIEQRLAAWREEVEKRFAAYAPAALRIDVGSTPTILHLAVLRPERWENHGMGSFLKVGPGDVSVSPAARALLASAPYRSGLMLLEFLPPNVIGFLGCDLEMEMVPLVATSVSPEAWAKLQAVLVEQA